MICHRIVFVLLIYCIAGATTGISQSEPQGSAPDTSTGSEVLAGHSYHGEAFNEGPRQKAYFMEGTGKVDFPISTRSEEAQAFFNQGIGQLHGFWYFEAERTFRHIASFEPDCAMAYWGMAMANENNGNRAKGFIREAVKRKDSVTVREQMWIESLSGLLDSEEKEKKKRRRKHIRDLEKIILEFPNDLEAKAFLALKLYQFNRDVPINSHFAVDALLNQVFDKNPMHPAHHFRIHLWDREKPEIALSSAARCGQASPGIAHMWHMPGHIYSRLHRYNDAAWQQEASARVDHAHMIRDLVLPDQIHNYAHNNEWLIRNLNHVGRVKEALDLARNMIELPQHPTYNTLSRRGRSASYGRQRLLETLERYELWDSIIDLSNTFYLEASDIPKEQRRRAVSLGLAYLATGNSDSLKGLAEEYQKKHRVAEDALKAFEMVSVEEGAENENEDEAESEGEKEKEKEKAKLERQVKDVESTLQTLECFLAILEKESERASKVIGDLKGLNRTIKTRLWDWVGNLEEAEKMAEADYKASPGQVVPLANMIDLLHRNGKNKKAEEFFHELRGISSTIDIEVEPFQRLRPLAKLLLLPDDWKVPAVPADDLGERPSLADLGPFRWQPMPAPQWNLSDGYGNQFTLSDYQGQPMVLIFYIGYECLHCVQQIHKFLPKQKDFEQAGIKLVAISSDTLEKLKSSLDKFELEDDSQRFLFPLLSDASLEVFKKYRAYDDFEKFALHGTFLIDGKGLIRWQDISYEPFNDAEWLLKEAKRLLSLSSVLPQLSQK